MKAVKVVLVLLTTEFGKGGFSHNIITGLAYAKGILSSQYDACYI
jgi:hypothetical protein